MLTSAVLEVKTFGGFAVSRRIGNETLKISEEDNLSKKIWAIIEFLILFRKRGATKAELIDAFWGDESSGNPENNLKALIFRARNELTGLGLSPGRDVIICNNNCYRINGALTFKVDAEQFETFCDAAEKSNSLELRLDNAVAAINLYEGDFLVKSLDYSWASALNIYYHAKYLKLCTYTISLLSKAGRYDEIIGICKKALAIEPYDELLHRSLIEAFISTGATQAAMRHYTYVIDLFITELSVSPSKELTALYRKITEAVSESEQDLFTVRESLQEHEEDIKPIFCGFATFRDIYKLEARAANRSKESVQLVMLSLTSTSGKPLSSGQVRSGMDFILQAVLSSLRMSDVFCQYSSTQFLILLPSASQENGLKAIERILKSFQALHPKVSYSVEYTLLEVLPQYSKTANLVSN